jgi:hypothetical protein
MPKLGRNEYLLELKKRAVELMARNSAKALFDQLGLCLSLFYPWGNFLKKISNVQTVPLFLRDKAQVAVCESLLELNRDCGDSTFSGTRLGTKPFIGPIRNPKAPVQINL